MPVVAIDDEQMAIGHAAAIDVARLAAFDPVRLRDGFVGNRVEREALPCVVIHAVAFVANTRS